MTKLETSYFHSVQCQSYKILNLNCINITNVTHAAKAGNKHNLNKVIFSKTGFTPHGPTLRFLIRNYDTTALQSAKSQAFLLQFTVNCFQEHIMGSSKIQRLYASVVFCNATFAISDIYLPLVLNVTHYVRYFPGKTLSYVCGKLYHPHNPI